jgi:hypothetical protein
VESTNIFSLLRGAGKTIQEPHSIGLLFMLRNSPVRHTTDFLCQGPTVEFHDFIATYYEELQNKTMARMTHDILGNRGEFLIIGWKPKH